jgi:hypothetical protein
MLGNGSIIGKVNAPSTGAAKGIWSLREALLAKAAGNWPANVASVAMTDHAVDTTDSTTYTFTSKSLGAAASGRKIIVCVGAMAAGAIDISSVTVAGAGATSVVSSGSATEFGAIFIIDDATNATGTIVVTFTGSAARCGIGVFAATGLNSSTATDTGGSTANPSTDTLNVDAGGTAVGHVIANSLSATPTFSWTNLTETYDETVEGPDKCGHSGACANFSAAQSLLAMTATPSSYYAGRFVAASFR